ncbi:hypothetical protein DRN69_08825 [Candidatus Pacearchaeota archaeon]|nr:MAG: hypothetical protein DRN69_08825 [Candidatus Pacearchaeota archaeon]
MIPFSFFLFGFYNLLTFPRENIVAYLITSVGMIILGIIWFFEFGFNEIIPDLLRIAKARIKAWKKKIRKEGTRKTLERTKRMEDEEIQYDEILLSIFTYGVGIALFAAIARITSLELIIEEIAKRSSMWKAVFCYLLYYLLPLFLIGIVVYIIFRNKIILKHQDRKEMKGGEKKKK